MVSSCFLSEDFCSDVVFCLFVFVNSIVSKINYLFLLHRVFVDMSGLSLVAASGGYSLAEVRRLLTAVVSIVVKRRF